MKIEYSSREHLKELVSGFIDFAPEQGTFEILGEGHRTSKQQSAIEVSCRQLGESLNEQGFDQVVVLKAVRVSEVWWTQTTVKDNLYKPLLEALSDKKTTTAMSTKEPSEVYDKLCAVLITKLNGFTNPPRFASKENAQEKES